MFLKSILVTFVVCLTLQTASAASLYTNSVEEIRAVLNHPTVKKALSAKGRAEVTTLYKEGNVYTISTSLGCVGSFSVTYQGVPMPGAPASLFVDIFNVTCQPSGRTVGN